MSCMTLARGVVHAERVGDPSRSRCGRVVTLTGLVLGVTCRACLGTAEVGHHPEGVWRRVGRPGDALSGV